MQTLAEQTAKTILGSSLFFSTSKGHDNPSKVLLTIAYQLATKLPSYRTFLCDKLTVDPLLSEKSITKQFSELIFDPFVRRCIYQGPDSLLVLIDGLDECRGEREQLELTGLISYFAAVHPRVPLIWTIATRPEPYIIAFLSRSSILPHYVKEELLLDSTEACQDVEHYLLDELERIKESYLATRFLSNWPTETQILKITAAGSGLFAFAATVIRFVDDILVGNPKAQLDRIIEAIENTVSPTHPLHGGPHPMAHLDALYTYILSQIPKGTLPITRALLRHYLPYGAGPSESFALTCNWLSLTPDVVFGAMHRLHSVFDLPTSPSRVDMMQHRMGFLHQSFCDYLSDPIRSGVYALPRDECVEQDLDCAIRVLNECGPGIYSPILRVRKE
ncbi:hypothetical protein AN958_01925 [Leucoagaricus sp. SymC.cos]|nr:hypothetical protein AN958_01925 [Leucoagaricus sp. SymC.cos]